MLSTKLINSKNNKSLIFSNAQSSCAIILINPKGPCIYLLMGFNDYLDLLVNVESETSISTILLVDVDMGSFSPNKYVPTPWTMHTKTTVRGAPSFGNRSCSKSDLSPPLTVAIAATRRRRSYQDMVSTCPRSISVMFYSYINPIFSLQLLFVTWQTYLVYLLQGSVHKLG